jgi:hypothetical protein
VARGGYTVTIRRRGRTERERYDKRGDALDAVESMGRDLEGESHARPEGGGLMRKIEPAKQVVGRIELSGPGRRELVEQRRGESAYQALRRVVKSRT